MRFNFVLIDPPDFPYTHFLFDTVSFLQGAVADLGFSASVRRNTLENDAVNVLCGVHLLRSVGDVDTFVRSGAPYVVLQTELVGEEGINGERSDRLERILLPLLREAEAVWDSSPDNIAVLKRLGVTAELLEFGYTEAVSNVTLRAERDVDFFFCGSVTPHRDAILSQLRRLGYRVEVRFDDAAFFRNDLMARSEVMLSLKQSPDAGHLPAARILHAVANGCLVAGESGAPCPTVDDLFLGAGPEEDLIEHLRRVRADPERRAKALSFQARLQARPMSRLLSPLIERLATQKGVAA